MNPPFRKAMILAAGLGTRLQPVTESTPKPLVPVLNIPNLVHNIHLLKNFGVESIIINTYHLPEQLERYLGNGTRWGVKISYSRETKLLGTGGGVKKAERFFEGEPFVLMNCDFVAQLDLRRMAEQHLSRKALATMVLFSDDSRQRFYSEVGVDETGHLCALPSFSSQKPKRTGIFTGIHFLDPSLLAFLKEEPCGINEILYPKLMREFPGRVYAEFIEGGYWYDTGNIAYFCETSLSLLARLRAGDTALTELLQKELGYVQPWKGIWTAKGTTLPKDTKLAAPVVIGANCKIGSKTQLGPNVVLGNDTLVPAGTRLSHVIGLDRARFSGEEIAGRNGAIQFGEKTLPATVTQ